MTEQRRYFRIRTHARLTVAPIPESDLDHARLRIRARHVAPPIPAGSVEETRLQAETRLLFEFLQRITLTLDRIDRRLEDVLRVQTGGEPMTLLPTDPVEITLSASGLACPLDLGVEPGILVEVMLDLADAGLPAIPALARVVRRIGSVSGTITALRFVEILPEDRERLVQLSLKRQSQALRENRMGVE